MFNSWFCVLNGSLYLVLLSIVSKRSFPFLSRGAIGDPGLLLKARALKNWRQQKFYFQLNFDIRMHSWIKFLMHFQSFSKNQLESLIKTVLVNDFPSNLDASTLGGKQKKIKTSKHPWSLRFSGKSHSNVQTLNLIKKNFGKVFIIVLNKLLFRLLFPPTRPHPNINRVCLSLTQREKRTLCE